MASSINGSYRVPLGYILTNGLKSVLLANVIMKTLGVMNETNSIAAALTFDGLRSNLSAVQNLGANLDALSEKFNPSIEDTITDRKISIILNACHMIKLMRNFFKHYSVVFNENGERIYWWYIKKLHETQELAGLKSAPKIGSRHVKFELQKMKTKLALQVMSNSVAVSLAVCRDLKIPGFENSEATQEFLEIMNGLFDLLNSRSGQCGNKAPLDPSNKDYRIFFIKLKKYLLSLSVMEDNKRVLLVESKRSTAVRGLVTTMTSIGNIMTNFVENPDEDLRCLATYKLSQDKLELFFSILRSRNGSNNNPNVVQLRSSVKKILCMQAESITTGNCADQEETLHRICPLKNISSIMDNEESCAVYEDSLEDKELQLPSEFQDCIDNVVTYIAGAVGAKIGPKLQCSLCICKLFPSDEHIEKIQRDCVLLLHCDTGGLFLPSFFLISICKLTEKYVRQFESRGVSSMSKDEVLNAVMNNADELYNLHTNDAQTSSDAIACRLNHGNGLLRAFSSEYIKIRFHHTARQHSLKLNPTTNKSACTKKYLFDGQ